MVDKIHDQEASYLRAHPVLKVLLQKEGRTQATDQEKVSSVIEETKRLRLELLQQLTSQVRENVERLKSLIQDSPTAIS
jgi:hypothetical protein